MGWANRGSLGNGFDFTDRAVTRVVACSTPTDQTGNQTVDIAVKVVNVVKTDNKEAADNESAAFSYFIPK